MQDILDAGDAIARRVTYALMELEKHGSLSPDTIQALRAANFNWRRVRAAVIASEQAPADDH